MSEGFAEHSSPLIVCAGVTVCALLGFSLIISEELAGADYTAAPGQKQKLRQKLQTGKENIRALQEKTKESQATILCNA